MRSRTTAWRRLLVVLALTLTVGLLAACGGDDSSSDGTTTAQKADGPVEGTLTYYNFQPTANEDEWWDEFIADFEKKYPGAKVETTLYSTQDYWIKTLAAFSSGNEPDVFIPTAGEDLNKYIRAGKIAPLDDLVDLDAYNPAALDPFKAVNGKVNGVPSFSFVILGWANDDLLAKEGLSVPTTWDELLSACETLSAKGIAPIAMGNSGQDRFPTEHLLDTLIYQYGGLDATLKATYGEDGQSWDGEAVTNAATRMTELVDAKCFPRGFTGLNYAQMTGLFLQGKAAMTFTGSWISNQVTTSGVKFKASTFPFPDAPDAEHSTANLDGILGGVSGLSVSAKAAERNPALVAAFLNEFGKRVDEYANETGSISVAAAPKPQGSALQKEMSATFEDVAQLASVSDTILPRNITELYLADQVALTAGKLTPEAFATGMAEKVERERGSLPPRDGS